VIGRVFRELGLIEQWGSGIGRMIEACSESGLQPPLFQEVGNSFKVTLFNKPTTAPSKEEHKWRIQLNEYLLEHNEISTVHAARIWDVSDRAARARLRKLVTQGILAEIGTGPKDPKKVYVLKKSTR